MKTGLRLLTPVLESANLSKNIFETHATTWWQKLQLILPNNHRHLKKDRLIYVTYRLPYYEESVVDKFKSNLLLMIFWLNIINYNS
jgi:hypothetical protein